MKTVLLTSLIIERSFSFTTFLLYIWCLAIVQFPQRRAECGLTEPTCTESQRQQLRPYRSLFWIEKLIAPNTFSLRM